jgi:hypothetical protein
MTVATLERVSPLVTNDFATPDGKMRFSASCFSGINWSLARLQTNADVDKNDENKLFANHIKWALQSVGALIGYAPNPTEFNGKVGRPGDLTDNISLYDGMYIRRNKKAPMDGTFLPHKRDAGIFSAGGCGVIVATYRHRMVFAHAGRECLLDRLWVESDGLEQSRKNISVVDSIIEAFGVPKSCMHEVHFWMLYFIKPEHFVHRADDKKHGVYNRAAIRFLPTYFDNKCCKTVNGSVLLDLSGIARLQCLRHGVPSDNIHMEHRYLDDELPHTRKDEGTTRYLVAIVRNS